MDIKAKENDPAEFRGVPKNSLYRMTREAIHVMSEWCAGKQIQQRSKLSQEWRDCHIPDWDWSYFVYRVKP